MRPSTYSSADDPFYIANNTKLADADKTPPAGIKWFKSQPIGINKLATLMRMMPEKASIRPLTNHSARKHLVQKLNNSGIPPTHIMQITGHKNTASINSYSSININQHKKISNIIGDKSADKPVPAPNNTPLHSVPASASTRSIATTSMTSNLSVTGMASFREIFDNCHVQIENFSVNIYNKDNPTPPPKRRRINMIESDSSQE